MTGEVHVVTPFEKSKHFAQGTASTVNNGVKNSTRVQLEFHTVLKAKMTPLCLLGLLPSKQKERGNIVRYF